MPRDETVGKPMRAQEDLSNSVSGIQKYNLKPQEEDLKSKGLAHKTFSWRCGGQIRKAQPLEYIDY